MPTRDQIISFVEDEPPPGESPWVAGQGPTRPPAVVEYDPAWPAVFEEVAAVVRGALGDRVLELHHVGSTSVPGLAAKPVIDLDLIVADPGHEESYVPALVAAGFVHRVREPWWWGHRMLRLAAPEAHLHVFGPDAAEPFRHRLFRDWLVRHPEDRDLYAAAKRTASAVSAEAGEDGMQYNARKADVVRGIYARIFTATGLTAD